MWHNHFSLTSKSESGISEFFMKALVVFADKVVGGAGGKGGDDEELARRS